MCLSWPDSALRHWATEHGEAGQLLFRGPRCGGVGGHALSTGRRGSCSSGDPGVGGGGGPCTEHGEVGQLLFRGPRCVGGGEWGTMH